MTCCRRWAHEPERLTAPARQALELGRTRHELAIADISLWELALLHERGRLGLPEDISAGFYLTQLLAALRLQVQPITPEIALLQPRGDAAARIPVSRQSEQLSQAEAQHWSEHLLADHGARGLMDTPD